MTKRTNIDAIKEESDMPKTHDEMSKEEFDAVMKTSLEQAKQDKAVPANEAFDSIIGEIKNAEV